MSLRLLGSSDGRRHRARRPIHKLIAMGLSEADVIRLMREEKEPRKKDSSLQSSVPHETDRAERLDLAQWAIRVLLALGFSEGEIAAMVDVDHTTIAHALQPDVPRAPGWSTVRKLKDAVQNAGAERLRRLLPRVAIKVLDTCSEKGHTLDDVTILELAARAQVDLQNALVFADAPVPLVPGVHAFLARIGDPIHGLYLIKVPPEPREDSSQRLAHLQLVEHEIEHLLDRYRSQRGSLENQKRTNRPLPKEGSIA